MTELLTLATQVALVLGFAVFATVVSLGYWHGGLQTGREEERDE